MTVNRQNVLVINPGSTSTKMATFHEGGMACAETIPHAAELLSQFVHVWDQYEFRVTLCRQWAKNHGDDFTAVAAMGGLLRPIAGGVYRVNATMLADARANLQGEHASNLGCTLAHDLAKEYHAPAFVVDPVSVDEFEPLAHYSGHPCIKRQSLSHALNIHAAARRASQELNIPPQSSSFVVGHLGGGISIAAVRGGKIIDVNDAGSDGPFSPERTGGLPLQSLISLCFSGHYTEKELRNLVMGKGGLVAYLGTNSLRTIEENICQGDTNAKTVLHAMAYQIAKEIGAMSTVLPGHVDAIVLTGGVAHSSTVISFLKERVQSIAPVIVYPGEHEMHSLAEGVFRVLRGEEQGKEY